MVTKVKVKEVEGKSSTDRRSRRGRGNASRLSSKHQVTIPVDVMREAGFKVGDELIFVVENGTVKIQAADNQRKLMALVGLLDGLYENYDHKAEMADAWGE